MDRVRIELDAGPRALAVILKAFDAAGTTVEFNPEIQNRTTEGSDEMFWVVVAIGDERGIEATIREACESFPHGSVKLRSQRVL